jgi:hypothetical protein
MAPHGTIASNGNPRFRCRNRDCSSYGKTSVERLLPTPADVRRSCEMVFPGVEWSQSVNINWLYFEAKTKFFTCELTVQKNGSRAYFYIGSQVLASENIKGRSVDEALGEIKEKIQDLVEELEFILGI